MMVVLSHVVLLIYTFTISFDFSACKLATKLLFFNAFFARRKKRGCQILEPVAICKLSCAKVRAGRDEGRSGDFDYDPLIIAYVRSCVKNILLRAIPCLLAIRHSPCTFLFRKILNESAM